MEAVQRLIKGIWKRLPARPAGADESPLRSGPNGPFVFIHVNKNAGTSIGRAIGLPKKMHLTVKEVIGMIGHDAWRGAYRFSIVRNPWDRAVSHYKHRVKTNQTGMQDNPIPFSEWVKATFGPEKRLPYYDQPKMFQPQAEWLKDTEGGIDLHLIGRFEDLADAYRRVAERLGLKEQLPHLNQSEKADYRTFYDDATAETVAEWFKEDVERFGYRFEKS